MYPNKNTLAGALTALGKLICRTSPVELYRSVQIENNDNTLTLRTFSPDESMTFTLESCDLPEFSKVILFDDFRNAVRSCRSKEISVELAGDGTLLIDGKAMTAVKDEDPVLQPVPAYATKAELPENFVFLLSQAATAASRTDPRKILHGILIDSDGITSTNGKELFHVCHIWDIPGLTIPLPLALMATKASTSGVLYMWQKEQATVFRITIGPWSWQGNALQGTYPNWKQVLPEKNKLDFSVSFEEGRSMQLQGFLKNVPDNPPNNAVELSMGSDHATLDVDDHHGLKTSIAAEFPQDWGDFSIQLNRDYLQHLLQLGHNRLYFSKEHLPVLAEGGTGLFVTMPLFVKPINTQSITHKEETMENNTNAVAVNVPSVVNTTNTINAPAVTVQGTPLDELSATIEEFRSKLRAMFDESSSLSRKVKEVALAQKQKERDFIQAKRAIERIRMAI